MLTWHGYARVATGDADGTSDMWTAADTLARHAHSSTPWPTVTRGLLRGLGEMRATDGARRCGWARTWQQFAYRLDYDGTRGSGLPRRRLGHQRESPSPGRYHLWSRRGAGAHSAGRIALAGGDHQGAQQTPPRRSHTLRPATTTIYYFISIALAAMCYSAADRLADAIATVTGSSAGGMSHTARSGRSNSAKSRRPSPEPIDSAMFTPRRFTYRKAATGAKRCSCWPRGGMRMPHTIRTDRQRTTRRDAHLLAADQAHHKGKASRFRSTPKRSSTSRAHRSLAYRHRAASGRPPRHDRRHACSPRVRGGARQPDQASTS